MPVSKFTLTIYLHVYILNTSCTCACTVCIHHMVIYQWLRICLLFSAASIKGDILNINVEKSTFFKAWDIKSEVIDPDYEDAPVTIRQIRWLASQEDTEEGCLFVLLCKIFLHIVWIILILTCLSVSFAVASKSPDNDDVHSAIVGLTQGKSKGEALRCIDLYTYITYI